MKKFAFVMLAILGLVGCNDENTAQSAQEPAKIVITKADFEGRISKEVKFDVNEKGVVVFENVRDMFREFNNYREEDELLISVDNPPSILITPKLDDDKLQPFKEWNEMAFLYAIYQTFKHTNYDLVTVEAFPIAVSRKGKETALTQFTLKASITREKALEVLKKYSSAQSFADLVQLEKTDDIYGKGKLGLHGSKLWDQFKHNEKYRSNIVSDLVN